MDGYELEPDGDERRRLMTAIEAWVDRFLAERPHAPATRPTPDDALHGLADPPGPDGRSIDDVLADLERAIAPGFDTASPGFLSYIPSGGMLTSALGTFLGAVTNQYTGASHASPGATTIEQGVIDWMTSLFGLPDTAGGVLLSGGSLSNQTAVVAAREAFGGDFRDGVVYVSSLVHHSVAKAAHLAGIDASQVRTIDVDYRLKLDVDALRATVARDVSDGRRPMLVVATAGTTDVGSVDPLGAVADVATETGAWFHVDAAYGGFFQLTERGRRAFAGIERADSITIDAHKSLFAPFGVGGLLVRDIDALIAAHGDVSGAYLRDLPDLPHYFSMGPELTRPYRGLALWLPLQLHGVDRFRHELDRMLDLAEHTADALDRLDGVDVVLDPELSIVTFRADGGDDATEAMMDHLLASRELHLSSTTIDGRLTLRLAFLNQRTTAAIAERAIALVAEAVAA